MTNFCVRTLGFFLATAVSYHAHAAKPAISPLANSHPDYLALRGAQLGQSFGVRDLILQRDVGTFHLKSGAVHFLEPVLDRVPIGVFVGEGEFRLEPASQFERQMITLYTEKESVAEGFKQAVFVFTDDTYSEIRDAAQGDAASRGAAGVLENLRSRLRQRRESPQSTTEAIMNGSDMDNVDADILAGLLNSQRKRFFSAYIKGNRYDDLRFHVRPSGGIPQMLSDEPVALVNFAPGGDRDGIWYLSHRKENIEAGIRESNRNLDVVHYKIDAEIAGNKDLSATVEITLQPLINGERVLRFGLYSTLRVSEVTFEGQPTHFVQQGKKEDCGFYVIAPEALEQGHKYKLVVTYSGDEIIRSSGGGNFAVGARSSWYPSIGSFRDRATYELSFRYPKKFVLASVGDLVEEGKDGKEAYSKWKSDIPLKVAGFNYGDFKKSVIQDERTNKAIEGYATKRAPDILRGSVTHQLPLGPDRSHIGGMESVHGTMSPKRMMQNAMREAQVSTQLFTHWFGPLPYSRIAITQQPQFGFGQSWPTLVYLPVSAFLDSTQRWSLLGAGAFKFNYFVLEVTPHEVAHQWWGHLVGWDSYHDQWISEGFAEFSAGLFLQLKNAGDYREFLERGRRLILEKNEFGFSANDTGPLWMGSRLNTPKTGAAYSKLIYSKGGYVLHMLRQMMFDSQETGDERFIAMMRDFVETHHNRDATTESFQKVVEKHMTPAMNLDGNGKMDWFFRQWVYGNEVPSYEFQYSLTPAGGGKAQLKGTITQSGVSDEFVMLVPVYVKTKNRLIRLGASGIAGNTTSEFEVMLPLMPDEVVLNAKYDVLAEKVTTQRAGKK